MSHYLGWMSASLLATILLCAACNVFVDPLGIFPVPRLDGVNAVKPYIEHHRELARWYAAKRVCASAGIFGNSRAEIGFDPEHPGFRKLGLEGFNHAIPGTSITTSLQQFGWLQQAGCVPKVIVLGVEFFDFLSPTAAPAAMPAAPPPSLDVRAVGQIVFSTTGLRDAITTLGVQREAYPAIITARGFNPLLSYVPDVQRSGAYTLFRQKALANARSWSRLRRCIRLPDGRRTADFAALEAFLAAAVTAGSAVHVVIYPYHEEIRLMQERLGLGGLFQEWKAAIVSTTEKFAGKGVAVDVTDFSAVSAETSEPIPAPGDRKTPVEYYWEAGHFKKALGDRVLDQVLGTGPGFGMRLESGMLDKWLQADRQRVAAELARNSRLVGEVDSVLATSGGIGPACGPDAARTGDASGAGTVPGP